MRKAVVIGASSGMGLEVTKLLLNDGWQVGVAARRLDRLISLKESYPELVCERIDVNQADAADLFLHIVEQLGGMDLLFYSAGIGKKNPQLISDIELNTVQTNALGFTRMVNAAFQYMASHGGGHIAVISSIAGTKGLGPAPSYSATKAFQNCYIEALEQQAHARNLNIAFTDIRPGFVDTDLLGGDNHYPMLMNPQKVSKQILSAIYRKKHVAVIDGRWRCLTFFWRMVPRFIWRRLRL